MTDPVQRSHRDRQLNAIDAMIEAGPIDKNIPEDIETSARQLFEEQTRIITGHTWAWGKADECVRHRYRIQVLLAECRPRPKFALADKLTEAE